MSRVRLTPAKGAVLAGAAIVTVGSLLDVFGRATAWSAFPVLTLPVFLALAVAGQQALLLWSDLRPQVLDLTPVQLGVAGSAWATLMMVCFVVGEPGVRAFGTTLSPERGRGLWLMLAGSVLLLAGSLVDARRKGPRPLR